MNKLAQLPAIQIIKQTVWAQTKLINKNTKQIMLIINTDQIRQIILLITAAINPIQCPRITNHLLLW